jgi:hypothetical protein
MPQICSHSRTIIELLINYVYVVFTNCIVQPPAVSTVIAANGQEDSQRGF